MKNRNQIILYLRANAFKFRNFVSRVSKQSGGGHLRKKHVQNTKSENSTGGTPPIILINFLPKCLNILYLKYHPNFNIFNKYYIFIPQGAKKRSLSARGKFDSLIFYQDLNLYPEDFFFIWVVGGRRWPTNFGHFHTNNIIIYKYIYNIDD